MIVRIRMIIMIVSVIKIAISAADAGCRLLLVAAGCYIIVVVFRLLFVLLFVSVLGCC